MTRRQHGDGDPNDLGPKKPASGGAERGRLRRTLTAAAMALLILAVVVAGGVFAWWQMKAAQWDAKNRGVNAAVAPFLKPKAPGKPFFMVVMGVDKRPGERIGNSDTLMVAYVDPPNKRVGLLSIPRDTRVHIPGYGTAKINAAALIGGPPLVIRTVKQFTGLPITHYAVLDFNGFRDLVNAIGGVTVNVPRRIVDAEAANHVPNATIVEAGVQKLDGDHALTFVRSRKLPGDDFTRIKDQQIFIKALAQQTLQVGNVFNAPKIVDALMRNVVSDLTIGQMVALAGDFKGAGSKAVEGAMVPGDAKYIDGVAYVIPDQARLVEMVQRFQSGGSLETSQSADGTSSVGLTPSQVSVTVRNGSGEAGLAAECGAFLRRQGFEVTDVGTLVPGSGRTLVVSRAETLRSRAQLVRDRLAFGQVAQAGPLNGFKTDVLVVVGKDWRSRFPNGPPER